MKTLLVITFLALSSSISFAMLNSALNELEIMLKDGVKSEKNFEKTGQIVKMLQAFSN
ncbi:MAG: hypothetical protein Q7U04_16155 [Bacteriovorax sp.]|nr:hypothetical protein [Bacteriovorax sp.]